MVTIHFLKFKSWNKLFALSQMALSHRFLKKVKGCTFYKLMGTGAGNGFSILPDLSTYSLLMNWKDEHSKKAFFKKNKFWKKYLSKAKSSFHIDLMPMKSIGKWDGKNPFLSVHDPEYKGKIAVLTRGKIKKRLIPYFWSQVPKASEPVQFHSGHIFSKGIGELPLVLQATISLWENKESMYNYAYRDKAHIDVIRKTREKGWYKEELFAEFKVLRINGNMV